MTEPDIIGVFAAQRQFVEAMRRLPGARTRAERTEIHATISRTHRVLMTAQAWRSPGSRPTP